MKEWSIMDTYQSMVQAIYNLVPGTGVSFLWDKAIS